MARVAKIVLPLLLIATGSWMLRPWVGEHLATRARTAYFDQGRAYAPRVLEELGRLPPELRESSGLAVSRTQPGVLWSHNDSGDGPTLYAIDVNGHLLATVAVANVVARDWEDIAAGPCPADGDTHCLYVADTGNNDRSRDVLTIYVIAEPMIVGADSRRPLTVRARSFRFRYPDQPEDTEALAVLPNGDVTVVTKGRTPTISFFGFPAADVAKAVTSGEVLTAANQGDSGIAPDQGLGRWVTAAAMSPDGKTLAVRTYSEIFFYAPETGPSTALGAGPKGRRWRDLERPCFLGAVEPQGEAIDYLDDKTLILASETSQGRQGVLHRVQCNRIDDRRSAIDTLRFVHHPIVRRTSSIVRFSRRADGSRRWPTMTAMAAEPQSDFTESCWHGRLAMKTRSPGSPPSSTTSCIAWPGTTWRGSGRITRCRRQRWSTRRI